MLGGFGDNGIDGFVSFIDKRQLANIVVVDLVGFIGMHGGGFVSFVDKRQLANVVVVDLVWHFVPRVRSISGFLHAWVNNFDQVVSVERVVSRPVRRIIVTGKQIGRAHV